MHFLYYTLALLFAIVCVFMVLVVLIQKGRGGGLSSAFGGAGGNTAFGTKTGDLLTWVTCVIFAAFVALACGMTWTADYLSAQGMATDTAAAPITSDTFSGESSGESGAQTTATDESAPAPAPAPASDANSAAAQDANGS